LLAGHPPPTAIVTANNLVSIGALNAFKTLGFNVPQDVSFVGFDDLEFWRLSSPQPTVVSRPMLEQGAIAVRLLLNRIRGLDTPPQRIVLQTQLVIRESCRALAE
jgi:DNA-binding LacI/PurR family transcriptional regulator